MKRREIETTGTVDQSGRLKMYMGELNAFFAQHKGERIVARFVVAPVGSSEALKGYYFHYVVPTIRKGFWDTGDRKTEEQTERFLRELSPVCYDDNPYFDNGEIRYNPRLREIRELSNSELIEHIDCIRQFAAEELNVYVDDPKTL